MTEEGTPEAKAKSSTNMVRIVFWILFLVGAGAFAVVRIADRKLVARENEATELYNRGQHQRALKLYLDLYDEVEGEQKERVATHVAKSYVKMGESTSGAKAREHFEEALKYDEEAVPKNVRKRLQRGK